MDGELVPTNREMGLSKRGGVVIESIRELREFAELVQSTDFCPTKTGPNYQKVPMSVGDIMVAVQYGYEVGLSPMQALQNVSVINGRPAIWGDAMLALVQASGELEDIQETIIHRKAKTKEDGTVAVCKLKRRGRPSPTVSEFGVVQAKRAGLWTKKGPWHDYPRRMLQMRARGFALRDAFPDVLKGLISVEEARDYPREVRNAEAKVKDVFDSPEPTKGETQDMSDLYEWEEIGDDKPAWPTPQEPEPEPVTPEPKGSKLIEDITAYVDALKDLGADPKISLEEVGKWEEENQQKLLGDLTKHYQEIIEADSGK